MNLEISPWTDADNESVRVLASESAILPQFEKLKGPGRLEHWLADPFCDRELRFIARADGVPVGFAYAFLLSASDPPGRWCASP